MAEDLHTLVPPCRKDSFTFCKPNNTIVLILMIIQFLLLISVLLISFLLPLNYNWQQLWSDQKNPLLDSYAITNYSHIFVWLIILAIRCYIQKYYKKLHVNGYFTYNDKVGPLASIPATILNKSNALLLALTTILFKHDGKMIQISNGIQLKPINWAQIVITIAVVIIVPSLAKCFYHELKFRSFRSQSNTAPAYTASTYTASTNTESTNAAGTLYMNDLQHLIAPAEPQSSITSVESQLLITPAEPQPLIMLPIPSQTSVRSSSHSEELLKIQADTICILIQQNRRLQEKLDKATPPADR